MTIELPDIIKEFDLKSCMQCGKCTASCPAGFESNLRTRLIIYLAKSGTDVLDMKELWCCTTCYSCQERCPKNVKVTDAIIRLRNLAVKNKNFPKIHVTAINAIKDTSDGFPLTPEVSKIRSLLGLPIEPHDVAHDAEELKKFKTLLDSLSLLDLMEVLPE